MKKIILPALLIIAAVIYFYRGEIMVRVVENRVPAYISDFCECEEIVAKLKSFSPSLVKNWANLEDKDKLRIMKAIQSIQRARKQAALGEDPGLSYEDIESLVDEAGEIAQKYEAKI